MAVVLGRPDAALPQDADDDDDGDDEDGAQDADHADQDEVVDQCAFTAAPGARHVGGARRYGDHLGRNIEGCEFVYAVWRPLSRDVWFCFLSDIPVTNWAAQ